MIDIDDFKAFNDTYGHPQGDALLAELAEVLLQVTRRDIDIVARYGGEEFTIVLPSTPALGSPAAGPAGSSGSDGHPAALAVAERVRQKVAAHTFESAPGHRDAHVTVSLGVAELTDADTMTYFLAHSDEALYEAKRSGKDTTVLYRR